MRRLFSPILCLVLLAPKAEACDDYTAAATVFERFYAQLIGLDRQGNICRRERLPAGFQFTTLLCPRNDGRLITIDGETTPYISVYSLSSSRDFVKTQELNIYEVYMAFSPDGRYAVGESFELNNRLLLFKVSDSRLHLIQAINLGGRFSRVAHYSRVCGRFIRENHTDTTLELYRITPDGSLVPEGPAISYYHALGNMGMAMSPDGRTCIILSIPPPVISVFRIHDDGTITKVQAFSSPDAGAIEWAAFTPDSRYAIIWYTGGLPRPHEVESYRVERDGSLTKVDGLGDILWSSGSIAITPDGNFLLLAHNYTAYGIRYILSAIRIHHDGTLTRLTEKDLVVYDDNGFFYSQFIPPQVLGAYGAVPEGTEMPVYMETFADWQGGSVPGVFDVPESWVMPDGSLALRPTSTTNCFGFWQSPVDALMVVPYSVYRAQFAIRASNAGSPGGPEPILPTLRLRTNAQTLQQADTLVLNSTPGGFLKTNNEEVPSTFTLLFEPPISSCSREEEMDDVFCSLDLMAFNGEADIGTTYVLSRVLVDRLPVECFDVDQVVCDYEFTEDEEGWTYGGAPAVFNMPQCSHAPGALLISAAGKTNCFGFWNSDPADAVTTTAEAIYRATFYVRTNQPDRWRVPTFRLRLGTSLGSLVATHEIISANDSEMSPYYDSSDPAYQFEYPVYLYKPKTEEPLNLLLAFDLLNFDETDDANTLLILDRVRLDRLTLPTFPLND
jgi:hypothetical protein